MKCGNVRRYVCLAVVALTSIGVTSGGVATAGSTMARAATAQASTLDPSHGGKATDWTVVTPSIVPDTLPPLGLPRCHASEISATAITRPIPGGVAGIMRLRGDHCAIYSTTGPDQLAADGTALGVASTPWSQEADPPDVALSSNALLDGRANWSFTWLGSWCGDPATSISLQLNRNRGIVTAPLTGAQPDCATGPTTSPSTLRPGVANFPTSPDMWSPPSWAALQDKLAAPAVLHSTLLRHVAVTITNPSNHDIPLAPCPTYALTAFTPRGDGGTTSPYGGTLRCHRQPRVVPADGSVVIRLAPSRYDVGHHARHLSLTFAVVGLPVVKTTSAIAHH